MTEVMAAAVTVMMAEMAAMVMAEVAAVMVVVPEAAAMMTPMAAILHLGEADGRSGDFGGHHGGGGLGTLRCAEQHGADHRENDGERLDQAGSS
ncbi:hypothetical protein ASF60_11215 [Methylobacterium sp. Leaf113]|nr:hypothetical protein ASF60_11215 [Methylobacterium sp. Leaf113]